MQFTTLLKRGWQVAILLLPFLLVSCSFMSRHWELDYKDNFPANYESGKMFLTSDTFNTLDLEIVKRRSGMNMYICVHSAPVPALPDNPEKTMVTVSMNDYSACVEADRLRGGQKILLPKEITKEIISALKNNQRVHISVGRYEGEIVPTGFCEHYRRLERLIPCDVI